MLRIKPVIVVARFENERHPVVQRSDDLNRLRRHDRERAYPLLGGRVLPVLPKASECQ
jgi:hypothetical protein